MYIYDNINLRSYLNEGYLDKFVQKFKTNFTFNMVDNIIWKEYESQICQRKQYSRVNGQYMLDN
jgi:hypothetical protein